MSSTGIESFSGGGNFFENLFADALNTGVQFGTRGLVGYKDGKLTNGVTTDVLREAGRATVYGLKEVTGANAAEQANELARQQMEEQRAAALAEREASQLQTAQNQMQQSNMAASIRGGNSTRTTGKAGQMGSFLGGAERDYLGL